MVMEAEVLCLTRSPRYFVADVEGEGRQRLSLFSVVALMYPGGQVPTFLIRGLR